MKKILKAAFILSAAAGLFSCTMDLRQPGAIDADDALTSIQDAQNLRRGLYANFRGAVAGGFVSNSEVQSDLFQPTSGYGNNYGYFFRWDFNVSEGGVEGVWGSCYGVIANANFFIENILEVLENPSESFSADDLELLKIYLGEAYFFRAYYHYELAIRFCPAYDASTAGNPDTGIPYVTVFNPTADKSTYPNRGTLAATYEHINADLDLAEEYITTPGEVGCIWLTADAVSAFRSRVYLNMKDYDNVIKYAKPLVDGGKYALVTTAANFKSMWASDSGQECIMMCDASNKSNELPSSYDIMYISYNVAVKQYQPGFIPSSGTIATCSALEGDFRFDQFFAQRTANEPTGSAQVYLFEKFPGNPALFPSGMSLPRSNYLHKPKPFRIAEVYLNLAEAYAMGGSEGDAVNYLLTLRSARVPGYSYSGTDVMTEIKNERVRELIGEGFRLWDLKRWGDPVERTSPQNSLIMYDHSSMTETFAASNPRFTWPIPKAEMDTNPNIGAQNPGY